MGGICASCHFLDSLVLTWSSPLPCPRIFQSSPLEILPSQQNSQPLRACEEGIWRKNDHSEMLGAFPGWMVYCNRCTLKPHSSQSIVPKAIASISPRNLYKVLPFFLTFPYLSSNVTFPWPLQRKCIVHSPSPFQPLTELSLGCFPTHSTFLSSSLWRLVLHVHLARL